MPICKCNNFIADIRQVVCDNCLLENLISIRQADHLAEIARIGTKHEMAIAETMALVLSHEGHIEKQDAAIAEKDREIERLKSLSIVQENLPVPALRREITDLRVKLEAAEVTIEMLSTTNTKEWLKVRGYEGVYNDDCGCELDDLGPCGEGVCGCTPGYKVGKDEYGNWIIGPKEIKEANHES